MAEKPEKLMAAYDASMDGQKAFLSVAGFVSSAADWIDFDGKWRDRLAQEGLRYFQMADFAHSVGDFEPFEKQEGRRRGLLEDLLGIISSHAYRKFGVTVEVEAQDVEFSNQNKLEYPPNALALAGELACGQALLWARAGGFLVPEFVFVDGDQGRGKLAEQIKALTAVMPVFKAKKDSPQTKAFTPLQAADILAYQMSVLNRRGAPRESFSYPFQELNRIPGGILKPHRRQRLRSST
jgi:hypothetical protein